MKRLLLAILILVALGGGGAAGWWFLLREPPLDDAAAAVVRGARAVETRLGGIERREEQRESGCDHGGSRHLLRVDSSRPWPLDARSNRPRRGQHALENGPGFAQSPIELGDLGAAQEWKGVAGPFVADHAAAM